MEQKKKILVVDDEQDLCDILRFNLQSAGYEVTVALSAEDALMSNVSQFDLVLLDIMLGGMSGFEMARMMKSHPETAEIPVIFLTAKDTEHDTLKGFSLGADDYITKPFSVREVLARVKAVLHRTSTNDTTPTDVLTYQGLHVDLGSKSVTLDGEDVAFTRTEFELLRLLLSHAGEVFSRQQLIDLVWPRDVIITGRTVDVNITRMRKKIGPYAQCIATRIGYGYYFKELP